jgi:hypothetical protein
MPTEEQTKKLKRLSGSIQQPPIPEWPPLPPFLKEKFPQYADQMDQYQAQVKEFFKKAGIIANT